VIFVGWVFFHSPTPHFALVFLRRMLGDTRGLKILPFELTNPLPFIEPTFIIALLAGIIFALPTGQWLDSVLKKTRNDMVTQKVVIQLVSDLGLIFLLILSIAETVSSTFTPSIYGAF
jgi:hypothetical protein